MRRSLVVLSALLLVTVFGIAGQRVTVVAGTEMANRVVDYETIFGSLETDGSLKNVRLVDQLRVFGEGDVTVTDPMSTEDFRNLLGEGDADVQDGAVVWNIPGLSGVQELITASTPDIDPPLGVVVTYFLDGERVEAEDLIGEAGSVDITFDVSNLTAESMELTFEDGAGNELTGMELVPIPMVAQLTLELPKGTFTEVEAPLADILTQPDGDLTVLWSMVLVPPIGETQQTLNLNAMTDGFELGRIQLAGAPVAPKDRPFLAFAEEELAAGTESAASLYSGSAELSGSIDDLHDGTLELLDGMQQLLDGSKELAAGLEEAASGSGELATGLDDAESGSGQITGGLDQLRDGLRQIEGGLKALAKKMPAAAQGADDIADGLGQLDAGLQSIKLCMIGATCAAAPVTFPALSTALAGAAATADALIEGAKTSAACAGDAANCVGPLSTAQECLTGMTCPGLPGSVSVFAVGISQLAAGLAEGIDEARAGVAQIQAGALELAKGLKDAVSGIQQLFEGAGSALSGANELHAGSTKLTAGLTEAADGAGLLSSGLQEAAEGSTQLADGAGQAKGGASQIEQGVYLINEVGVREISRSASQTTGELDRQLALMEAQDERAANESLLYGPPSSDQAEVVVGGSAVVLTMDALNESGDESVSRGVAAGIGLVVLGGLSLGIWGLRRRRA